MADFDKDWVVNPRWIRLVGRSSEHTAGMSRGSAFSFIADGVMPMLMGRDSPLNQSTNFSTLSCALPCAVLSPVNSDSWLDLVGNDWRDCSSETWNSSNGVAGLNGVMPDIFDGGAGLDSDGRVIKGGRFRVDLETSVRVRW